MPFLYIKASKFEICIIDALWGSAQRAGIVTNILFWWKCAWNQIKALASTLLLYSRHDTKQSMLGELADPAVESTDRSDQVEQMVLLTADPGFLGGHQGSINITKH